MVKLHKYITLSVAELALCEIVWQRSLLACKRTIPSVVSFVDSHQYRLLQVCLLQLAGLLKQLAELGVGNVEWVSG